MKEPLVTLAKKNRLAWRAALWYIAVGISFKTK